MREAVVGDVPTLVEMMAEFHAEPDYVLDRRRADAAFTVLLSDPRLGRIWLIEQAAAAVGYVVVTFVYGRSMTGSRRSRLPYHPAARGAAQLAPMAAAVQRECNHWPSRRCPFRLLENHTYEYQTRESLNYISRPALPPQRSPGRVCPHPGPGRPG